MGTVWNKGMKGYRAGIPKSKKWKKAITAGRNKFHATVDHIVLGLSISKGVRAKSIHYNGGYSLTPDGYIKMYVGKTKKGHTRYISEHRIIMEKILGRKLSKQEIVHHINGVPYDNRPENLMLFNNAGDHCNFHKKLRRTK